ncbi:MAG TPA: hypothetical protein VFR42_11800, partial [Candidatus Acidoferrum sp.]|nr:hypothetical protein [Candidatus Acidoferrum sp.]
QTWQEDCKKVDKRVWLAAKESKGVEGQNVGSMFCYGTHFSLEREFCRETVNRGLGEFREDSYRG